MNGESETKVYFAAKKELEEGKKNLMWLLRESRDEDTKIVIAHIHTPSQVIPSEGREHSASKLDKHNVKNCLDDYLALCLEQEAQAESLVHEADDVATGLLQLTALNGITKLVIGAGADQQYIMRTNTPTSSTAKTMMQHAHSSCSIWFVCNGNLICTRHTFNHRSRMTERLPTIHSLSNPSKRMNSISFLENEATSSNANPLIDFGSYILGSQLRYGSKRMNSISFLENEATSSNANPLKDFGSYILGSQLPYGSYAEFSQSKVNATGPTRDTNIVRPNINTKVNHSSRFFPKQQAKSSSSTDASVRSYPRLPVRSSAIDEISVSCEEDFFLRLSDYEEESTSSDDTFNEHSETIAEVDKLMKLEQRYKNVEEEDRYEELKKVKASKCSTKEVKRKKDVDALKVKYNEIFEKLEIESKKNKELEDRITDYNNVIMSQKNELSDARFLAKAQKIELEEFWQQYNVAVETVEKLRQKDLASTRIIQSHKVFSEFSSSEIQQATKCFSDMIGNGGFGNVYKGQLRSTTVAVKKLDPQSMQGKEEFRQEVAILGKVRHPYIVTLIGACSDSCTLIYEFLPNGCLADRLKCKNDTPLTWRTRTRIAIEICTALIFLHSSKPYPIVHGDLKPQNILLDANLVSKLGDFGICRLLQQYSSSNMAPFHQTCKLKGTYLYMDPEYLRTGKLTPYSDIYSFGIVILQLLTGEGPLGIIDKVKVAVRDDQFHKMTDHTAGPWPHVQAIRLADLGMKCCEISSKNRPDHMGEVLIVLKDMLNATHLVMDDAVLAPYYFFCPITMEIMEDPHFAADGFTYEAKAIKDWFYTGNKASPVTNETLPSRKLIQNLALRSDIKEWQQKHQHT